MPPQQRRTHAAASTQEEAYAEAQRIAQQHYETMSLLQGDAIRAAAQAEREALDNLRVDTMQAEARVKTLKEKAMMLSAENVSKLELNEAMEIRLNELSHELNHMTAIQMSQGAVQQQGEDERAAELTALFESTLERAARHKHTDSASYIPENLKAKAKDWGVRTTRVFYTPNGETRANALATIEVRLGRTTTFREICLTAGRYFGEDEQASVLEDENESIWPEEWLASRELARYRGAQTLRLVHR